MLRGGWHPLRSIVIAGWDGEEIESAGLQSYQRRHHTEIERGCISYLDADRSVTGAAVRIDSAAAIAPLVVAAAHTVRDPAAPAQSLYDRWLVTPARDADGEGRAGDSNAAATLALPEIPVANIRFEGPFGVYHSGYDTLRYALRFSDPDFGFHRAAAQLYGLVALHLADADAVPYAFGRSVRSVRSILEQLAAPGDRRRAGSESMLAPAADRLTGAADRIDARIEAADPSISEREVRAVHVLNALLSGGDAATSAAAASLARATALLDGR